MSRIYLNTLANPVLELRPRPADRPYTLGFREGGVLAGRLQRARGGSAVRGVCLVLHGIAGSADDPLVVLTQPVQGGLHGGSPVFR